jgi:hypothetical protein
LRKSRTLSAESTAGKRDCEINHGKDFENGETMNSLLKGIDFENEPVVKFLWINNGFEYGFRVVS